MTREEIREELHTMDLRMREAFRAQLKAIGEHQQAVRDLLHKAEVELTRDKEA